MDTQLTNPTPTIFDELAQAVEGISEKATQLDEKFVELAKLNGKGDAVRNRIRRSLKARKSTMIDAMDGLKGI